MNWWQKLQGVIARSHAPAPEQASGAQRGSELLVPAAVSALCCTDDALFRVEIRGVGVTSIRLHAPRALTSGEYVVRVPVGLNFENRETTEYVEFVGVPRSCRKADGGYEAELRYTEASNKKRDRWIKLVLQSYGFSVTDEGEVEAEMRDLPCKFKVVAYDQEVPGVVQSLSLKGMVAQVRSNELEEGRTVVIELGLPGDATKDVRLSGRIVECEPGDGVTTVGVAFDNLDPEQYQHIVGCVSSLAR